MTAPNILRYRCPMLRLKQTLLILTALITGGGAAYIYLRLGNDALPPVLLGALIAITCLFRLVSLRR